MSEIEELAALLSVENDALLDVLVSLRKKHEEMLNVFEDARKEVLNVWKIKKP